MIEEPLSFLFWWRNQEKEDQDKEDACIEKGEEKKDYLLTSFPPKCLYYKSFYIQGLGQMALKNELGQYSK